MAKQLGRSLKMSFDTYAKHMESKDDQRELRKMERIKRLGKVIPPSSVPPPATGQFNIFNASIALGQIQAS